MATAFEPIASVHFRKERRKRMDDTQHSGVRANVRTDQNWDQAEALFRINWICAAKHLLVISVAVNDSRKPMISDGYLTIYRLRNTFSKLYRLFTIDWFFFCFALLYLVFHIKSFFSLPLCYFGTKVNYVSFSVSRQEIPSTLLTHSYITNSNLYAILLNDAFDSTELFAQTFCLNQRLCATNSAHSTKATTGKMNENQREKKEKDNSEE